MQRKIVRTLLRVSSNQQLEADGDLSVQRQLVKEYIATHPEWILDDKEYFEGSNSGYSNAVEDRDVLQEALEDAKRGEYNILVAYKDDRIGRRMWEIGSYVMTMKSLNVDIYTVTDGCISPDSDDIMGQMMLALRYGNAQKSSSDTGKRVKDTAQKLVQRGKYMGGSAPYGYRLELSGEISKHGRALQHLVIAEEQAEVVRYIYELSLNKEYGSTKIAKVLNQDIKYMKLAPNDVWKSGTVTSILTNPIYAGYTAYKRREKRNGRMKRLENKDWIMSQEQNPEITIVAPDIWNKVQVRREMRRKHFQLKDENEKARVLARNTGTLPLVDVLYCGYCGRKMTNGSKYSYWTVKGTGERKANKIAAYKCQGECQGIPHPKMTILTASQIEPIVFEALAEYIGQLQKKEDVFKHVSENHAKEKKYKEGELQKEKNKLLEIQKKIQILEEKIPDAMTGEYPVSLEKLMKLIGQEEEKEKAQNRYVQELTETLKNMTVSMSDWDDLKRNIPTWQDVFLKADADVKHVLVNKLIDRIEVKSNDTDKYITIRFKVNLSEFLNQSGNALLPNEQNRNLILDELQIKKIESEKG